METPVITRDRVQTLCDKKFLRLYDLEYAEGKHYFNVSRRVTDELVCLKSAEEARAMLPDAVSCVVILARPDTEPRLLLSWEYRYPAGRYLLSVPAGLIDPEDRHLPQPLAATASREMREETGIVITAEDTVKVISPFLYSTPGMTDESNALVLVVLRSAAPEQLNQDGAEGSECFDGFELLTKAQAEDQLRSGRDKNGQFYSIYTWAALTWFVSGLWEKQ